MCGGGGGFFGAVLNVVSVFVPAVRPVAMVYNTARAVESGDPLNIALAAAGAYNAYSGVSDFGGADSILGNSGNPVELDLGGFASDLGSSVSSLGDTLYEKANDLVWGNESVFDIPDTTDAWSIGETVGQSVAGGASPADLFDPTGTINTDNLLGRIEGAQSIDALRETAPEALNASRAIGITQGTGLEGATNYLKDLYQGKNVSLDNMIKQLTPQTEGRWNAAIDTVNQMGQAPMIASNTPVQLQDVGQGFGTLNNVGSDTLSMPNSFDTNSINGLDMGGTEGPLNIKGMETPDMVDLSNAGPLDITEGFPSVSEAAAPAAATVGGSTMDKMGNLYEKIMKSQQMNPMQMGLRAAGGIDSYMQNKEAESKLNQMYERAMSMSDPYQADRALASQKWQEQVNDPSAGWDTYAAGIGPELQAANAKLAKAGRRNQIPMQLSLAKQNYMANAKNRLAAYNPNQFGAGSGTQVSSAFAPAMASMASNRNAPLFNAGSDILRSMRLSDIYG